MKNASYLNTSLSPVEYYKYNAKNYKNKHKDAIKEIISKFECHIGYKALDLGCGNGLATNLIKHKCDDIIGIDSSSEMVEEYKRNTGKYAYVGNFWEPLPEASCAIVTHALHLCPQSRIYQFKWRLMESGIKKLIITSPLKRVLVDLKMNPIDIAAASSGESRKTIWGWVFNINGK